MSVKIRYYLCSYRYRYNDIFLYATPNGAALLLILTALWGNFKSDQSSITNLTLFVRSEADLLRYGLKRMVTITKRLL